MELADMKIKDGYPEMKNQGHLRGVEKKRLLIIGRSQVREMETV